MKLSYQSLKKAKIASLKTGKGIGMTELVISIPFFIVYLKYLEYDKENYRVKVGNLDDRNTHKDG